MFELPDEPPFAQAETDPLQLRTYHREVQRVLSSRVLQHFADLRKYFGSISDIWKEACRMCCGLFLHSSRTPKISGVKLPYTLNRVKPKP